MPAGDAFKELIGIMARLRGPGGCPWDREQTHASITPYLIEEAYEVLEAISDGDDREFCTELGDLLLQVVFHAQMASERNAFAIDDVLRAINDKLVRRHPHVFADTQVRDAGEVLRNWSRIKAAERREKGEDSLLAGVPRAMPALLRAQRLGEKAAHIGFDWADTHGVFAKLREEVAELKEALDAGDHNAIEHELGDLLLAATSLARHTHVNAENALARGADRFTRRFRFMESAATEADIDLREATTDELERLWRVAKAAEAQDT